MNLALGQLSQMMADHTEATPLPQMDLWQQATANGFFVLSLQLQVLHVSPWLWRALGYSSEGPGFTYAMSFIHQDFAGQVYEDVARIMSVEIDKIQHHERLKCQDDSFKWFICVASVGVFNGDQVLFGSVVAADSDSASLSTTESASLQKTIGRVGR